MVVTAASSTLPSLAFNAIYVKMWHGLSNMEKDPSFEVSNMAKKLTDYVRNKVFTLRIDMIEQQHQSAMNFVGQGNCGCP